MPCFEAKHGSRFHWWYMLPSLSVVVVVHTVELVHASVGGRVVLFFSLDQIFILASGCLYSLTGGIMFAHTGVLNIAILSKNSTDISATPDQASWIAASTGFSGIVGFFLLTPIFQIFGRKPVHICMGIITLIGWIMLSVAKNVTVILAARILHGVAFGGVFIVGMTMGEYAHPKRRGYFLTMKKVTMAVGSLICHSLSIVCTWRQIALFAVATCTLSTIAIPFWPESPAFLAMKGSFQQCQESYFWLNEKSPENDKELRELISAQTERLNSKCEVQEKSVINKLFKQSLRKDFLKPCLISALTSLAIDCCGKFFLLAYVTQIILKMTNDSNLAIYCSIGLDALLITALCLSSFLVKKFQRRTLLFSLGFVSVILMFLISISTILQLNHIISSVVWIVPLILLLHGFVSHVGLIPIGFTLTSELFPLEHKGLGACISGVLYTLLYAFTMKLTPVMLDGIGIEGTFSVYGFIVSFCLAILFFVLPETKDKTLLDIENEFKKSYLSKERSEEVSELISPHKL